MERFKEDISDDNDASNIRNQKTKIRILYIEKSMIWFDLPGVGRFFAYPLNGYDFSDICNCAQWRIPAYVEAEFFMQIVRMNREDCSDYIYYDKQTDWVKNQEWYKPVEQNIDNNTCFAPIVESYARGKIRGKMDGIDGELCYILENELLPMTICADADTVHALKNGEEFFCAGYLSVVLGEIDKKHQRRLFSLESIANQHIKVKVLEYWECEYDELYEHHERIQFSGPFFGHGGLCFEHFPQSPFYDDVKKVINKDFEVGVRAKIEDKCLGIFPITFCRFMELLQDRKHSIYVGVLKTENGKYYLEAMIGTYAINAPEKEAWKTMIDRLVEVICDEIKIDFIEVE